jgi:hypothetical protein
VSKLNDEIKRKLEELISKEVQNESAEAQKRKNKMAEIEAEAQRAAPIKEEIKSKIDEFESYWKRLPPLDGIITRSFYRTTDEEYSIVATEDKRIECRGSGPNWMGCVDIFQKNDLFLLQKFRDAIEPLINEIIKAYEKQSKKL